MRWNRSRLHTRGCVARPMYHVFFCEHSKPVFPANHHRTRVLRVHVHIAPLKLQKKPQGLL